MTETDYFDHLQLAIKYHYDFQFSYVQCEQIVNLLVKINAFLGDSPKSLAINYVKYILFT